FATFPSKAPRDPPDPNKNGEDPRDVDTSCDDGDQTMYNGLLCAAGFKAGCLAVAQAQDDSGRWYRSPHRRWMWKARCPELLVWETSKTPYKDILYQERCAYGFSPDHNLSVLLYAVTQHDDRAYRNWLNWLRQFSTTTALCKGDGGHNDDCSEKVVWPRVCPEDIGHGIPPTKIPL